MIVCSLNEVEAYGRRAARGAGMAWGLAEEAGKAARWLAERGLPGVDLLVGLLKANDGRDYMTMAPLIVDGRWQAPNGRLCPICTGAALSDRIDALATGAEIYLGALRNPLLLASFLDRSCHPDIAGYELRWTGARTSIVHGALAIESESETAHLSETVDEVLVSAVGQIEDQPTHRFRAGGVEIADSVWRELNALAKRTYVPATDESRARGAGAGRTDND